MKKHMKTAILLFVVTLFCLFGFSCGSKGADDEKARREGVFRGTPLVLAEGERPLASVLPHIDTERNRVLCMAGGDGAVTVYACTPDGDVAEAVRSDPTQGEILCGSVSADGYLLVTRAEDESGSPVYSLVRAEGEDVLSANLDEILPASVSRDFYGAAADGAGSGNIVLLAREAAAVLEPDLSCRLVIDAAGGEKLVRSPDGAVWILSSDRTDYKLHRVDPQTGSDGFAETRALSAPEGIRGAWFDGDGELYVGTPAGIVRHRDGEEDALLMSFVNSAVTGTSAWVLAVPDDEHVLAVRHRSDIGVDLLTMYRKVAEEALGKTVLEVAVPCSIPNRYYEKIVLFNDSHDDIQVSVRDYSVYNTDEDTDAGNRMLALDILTGAYSPDLVAGQYDNDAVVNLCVERKFYRDLLPYLEADAEVNAETVFPCLLRAYDDGEGGMWGITDRFYLNLVIGERSRLGKYGEAGKWTVGELLDYVENLPEGVELIRGLCRLNAAEYLLGPQGCGAFIDFKNGTCDFESGDFPRFLRLLQTLPADSEEYAKTSPLASASKSEQVRQIQDGRVILYRVRTSAPVFEYLQTKLYCADGEAVPIGYPTSGFSGNIMRAETSWIVTSFSEHPDAAWELLKSIVRERNADNLPHCTALISDFDRNAEEHYGIEYIYYYDGGNDGKPYDPENPTRDSDLSSPGVVARYTEEDHERLKAWIGSAGTPLVSQVPEQVQAIIDEEIAAYLGGVGTAEDCAKKIQSRVSIWLAEHQ